MLKVKNLHSYYGKSHILQGINLSIEEGEIVSLLGRNGVGRSTFIKTIMGMVQSEGSILFNNKEILGRPIHEIANLGIGYVSENRDIFPDLTVQENLELGKKENKYGIKWSLEELFDLFPNLKNRIKVPGGVLSGGEQQMLTICRSLMGCPKLIMIDEPTEGLSPQMVNNVEMLLKKISSKGVSILLVEQKLTIAFNLSNRLYVMGHGKVVYEGLPKEVKENKEIIKEWLEVS
ncbi:MAG: ABC transporter ATP-binding protein [Pelagibacterales bacterium]|jgi:branched-chain amino acid transport system ATP-binding protein|nr:ABC transporter ATP-binding protein [Pelagibacterales bacterium]|tara:strand:+ start:1916 stop:2614 length:699 start_codon:yes stop_codon:yes gene_type:complete